MLIKYSGNVRFKRAKGGKLESNKKEKKKKSRKRDLGSRQAELYVTEKSMIGCSATTPSDEGVTNFVYLSQASSPTSCLRGKSPGYAGQLGIMKGAGLFSKQQS